MGRRAKLNEEQITEIRSNTKVSCKHFANLYGVSVNTVSAVRNRTGAYSDQLGGTAEGDTIPHADGSHENGTGTAQGDAAVLGETGRGTGETNAEAERGEAQPTPAGYQSLFNTLFRSQ